MKRGHCLLCGGNFGEIVLRERGYSGRACCGMVYLDPAPAGEIDALYDGHFDTYYQLAARVRLDFIHSVIPQGRLLEVGCGKGHLLQAARARGYRVAGVDPNPHCVEHAERLGMTVERSTIEDSRLPYAAFDVVYHVDLLSHFEDPIRSLEAMADRLAPEGVLAFEVGLLAAIDPRWYEVIGGVGVPIHRWLYSEASLRALLAKIGFTITKLKTFALLPEVALFAAAKLLAKPAGRWIRRRYGFSEHWNKKPRLAPRPEGAAALYDRASHLLRYRAGALGPFIGPRTLFVAATRRVGARANA